MNAPIFPPIPMDTVLAAHALFGRSNLYILVGDQVESLFLELNLNDSQEKEWQSDQSVAMLYLITAFQFIETLPDHLLLDALQRRVEIKYALHLPLNFPGLETGVLCKFRQWLSANLVGQQNLLLLLLRLSDLTAFYERQRTNLESNQIFSFVCQISRLGKIWEAFNQSLEALATRRPDWLLVASLPHWYECYGHPRRYLNLRSDGIELQALAQAIGEDGDHLLNEISASGDADLISLSEITRLRRVWSEEYEQVDSETIWRKETCANCYFQKETRLHQGE